MLSTSSRHTADSWSLPAILDINKASNLKSNYFLKSEKPNWYDITTVIIYFCLTMFVFLNDLPTKRDWLFFYSFGTHLTLYVFNYKSLRNFNIWIIWFIFSLFHVYMFYELQNVEHLQMFRGFSGHALQFTWILLLLFQLLRYISLKFQNQELVALSRSKTDLWEKRRITKVDAVCYFTYLATAILLDVATM